MGEAVGLGRTQPDGAKIVELRKRSRLKQEALANQAGLSVRLLREIERRNHSVPLTTITAIATALKVPPDQITLDPDISRNTQYPQYPNLKLRPVRSAYELCHLAEEAHQYYWDLSVTPTAATAKEMQQLLRIIRRLVERFSVTDEFDNEDAPKPKADPPNDLGYIPRLARLQQSLDTLWAGGVGVLAGSYYRQSLTSKKDKSPGMRLPRLLTSKGGKRPRIKFRGNSKQIWIIQGILEIRFVPGEVNEEEICIDIGIPPDHPESLDSEMESLESQLEKRKSQRSPHAQSQQGARASKNKGSDRGRKS